MLPSSKLLPMTIAGLATILTIKAYALATTTPTPALLRAGAEQALIAVGTTAVSGVITQANAASATPAASARSSASGADAQGNAGPGVVAAPGLNSIRADVHETNPVMASLAPASLPTATPVRPATPPRPEPAAPPAAPALSAQTQPMPTPAEPGGAPIAAVTPAAAPVAGPAAGPAVAEASPADRAALSNAQQPFDRASELVQREATIVAAEKRMNERVGELQALQQRLQGLDASLKERDSANWMGLVKLYEGMKPREAASIFNSLEKPVLLEILDRMKTAKASPILAAMDAERARQITADLAAKRTSSTTIAPDAPAKTANASPVGTPDTTNTN